MSSQIGIVQTTKGNTPSGTDCSAAAINTTTGNLLVALVETASSSTNFCTGVKNGAGVSFTQIGSPVVNSGPSILQMFYLKNITGASGDVIKASWGSGPSLPIVFVWEVENADLTSPFLTESTATATGDIATSGMSVSDDCLVLLGVTAFSVTIPSYSEQSGGIGIIFDDPALEVTGFSQATACAGHSSFAGSNSGIGFGVTAGDSSQKSMIAAAFKAATGKGVKINIVCDGDSITSGVGVTTPWPSSISLTEAFQVFNRAIPSELLSTMLTNAPTNIDPLLRANMTNICVIFGGTNDFALSGDSVATVEGHLSSYISARHSAGWKVVSVPMVDRGGVTTQKNSYNSWMAGLPSSLDAFVALPMTLTADGQCTDLTYFQSDNIHPNQTSDTSIIAPDVSSTIETLLAGPVTGQPAVVCIMQ
jgi:hypothetical protein